MQILINKNFIYYKEVLSLKISKISASIASLLQTNLTQIKANEDKQLFEIKVTHGE